MEYGGTTIPPSFGVASGSFPIKDAAGKTVRFSGFIKTEKVTHGFAGLWWRVDGGERMALAGDNMDGRGAAGTSDWTRYEIDLPVAAEATNINFGALLTGDGTAWFDSLAVDLDGVRYTGSQDFDFDFESEWPRGFFTGGGYGVVLDREVFHSGRQSLRMRYGAPAVNYNSLDAMPPSSGGVVTSFPAHAAVGKHVRVSGFIKTQNVAGLADLFWRVYGPQGLLLVQSLKDKPAGTTDWKRYEFEIDIPHTVSQIQFGTLLLGSGTAWFDSLQVEVDGVPYLNSPVFDLDFESAFSALGFRTFGEGCWISTDNEVFHTGRQSLRIEKNP
jgi:hypothetical protein